jgi:predicted phosphodiesterase
LPLCGSRLESMLRSVAVLSDIHGVLPVLDAVLGEPLVEPADVIVVTGDHAAGPMPVEVLDRLAGLGERAVLVRGNADRDLVTMARDGRALKGRPGVSEWAAGELRVDQVELLDALPHPVILDIDGFGSVL